MGHWADNSHEPGVRFRPREAGLEQRFVLDLEDCFGADIALEGVENPLSDGGRRRRRELLVDDRNQEPFVLVVAAEIGKVIACYQVGHHRIAPKDGLGIVRHRSEIRLASEKGVVEHRRYQIWCNGLLRRV